MDLPIRYRGFLLALISCVMILGSGGAYSQSGAFTVSKDDLRSTEAGTTLHRLNNKIRAIEKDWRKASEPESKEILRQGARAIKEGEEYQRAVATLKPLMGKTVRCFGSMCDDPDWQKNAISRMVKNPSATNCYYNRNRKAVCQVTAPRDSQVLESEPETVSATPPPDASSFDPQQPGLPPGFGVPPGSSSSNFGCPLPVYRNGLTEGRPYWGVFPGPLGTAENFSCVVCRNGSWTGLRSSQCSGPYPGN